MLRIDIGKSCHWCGSYYMCFFMFSEGNDDPSEVKLTLNYGNRSQFVLDKYKDLGWSFSHGINY